MIIKAKKATALTQYYIKMVEKLQFFQTLMKMKDKKNL